MGRLALSPILEEFSNLRVASSAKKARDDFELTPGKSSVLQLEFATLPEAEIRSTTAKDCVEETPHDLRKSRRRLLRTVYEEELGKDGLLAWQLAMSACQETPQLYSLSVLSAITQDRVVSNQLVQGGVSSYVFEMFLFQTLRSLRESEEFRERPIVVLMDNARIHHHERVLRAALDLRCFVLFNAEYSPWINPVEWFFNTIKKEIKRKPPLTK